ncbi:MAG: peptidoglycan-associated lipoprotein Pal [Candidatus Eisenbacteria sp.]|nr:peptidoglycan-associated lipoprotein Pal [Candidatus Eisenbacteria bacterium]
MKRTGFFILMIVLVTLVGGSMGCSKKTKSAQGMEPPVSAPEQPATPAADTPLDQTERPVTEPTRLELEDVFFDFDKSNLRSDAREALKLNAKALQDNPSFRILIEGHCDERGTREYNMALGDRRANTARDFIVRYGISASRIETISYGEERPFATGHDETEWALNRRAHFIIRD